MKKFLIAALLLTTTVASSETYAAPISQGCEAAFRPILNSRNITFDDLGVKANQDLITNDLIGNPNQLEDIITQCELTGPLSWLKDVLKYVCGKVSDDCKNGHRFTDICKSHGLCPNK